VAEGEDGFLTYLHSRARRDENDVCENKDVMVFDHTRDR
jgi:hypothetical protein